MGLLEHLESSYVDFSSHRTTVRELLELAVGAVLFVFLAWVVVWLALGTTAAFVTAAVLGVGFTIVLISQTYWRLVGRDDYRE